MKELKVFFSNGTSLWRVQSYYAVPIIGKPEANSNRAQWLTSLARETQATDKTEPLTTSPGKPGPRSIPHT